MIQRNAKAGPPPPLQIGKTFPDDHAILWAPVEGLTRSMELSPPAIVITQGALREVIRHLSLSPEQELLGFLIGEPCEHEVACRINGVWRRAQHAMIEVLRDASIADMVQSRRFRPPRNRSGLVALRPK